MEGNVLFNDALNTFYLWLYGIRHMVKDHSDSERGNPLPPHGILFLISSKDSFICIITDGITQTMVFVTPGVEHWLEREIDQSLGFFGFLQLYSIRMLSDHSDSKRENPLLPLHGLLFPVKSKGSVICTIPQTG